MNYAYTFKGTIYFRKTINQKALINRDKDLIYRKSLRKCLDKDFYSFLEFNNNILDKLLLFLNKELTKRLKEGLPMTITDIHIYIKELCENYRKEALIENTPLEDKRIEDMEYVDSKGNVHSGYLLQALSREYKILYNAYMGLEDTSKVMRLGAKIAKRTNIDMSKIIELDDLNKKSFFDLLIKTEKTILENDIENFIKRNKAKFRHLWNPSIEKEEDRIKDAIYEYIDLIQTHPIQEDYDYFLKSLKSTQLLKEATETTDINLRKESIEESLDALLKKQNSNEEIPEPKDLARDYIQYKGITNPHTKKNYNNALRLFVEYLQGDGEKYKAKNIFTLKASDIKEFEDLLTDCMPKDKKRANLDIFEVVELRKKLDFFRYEENTILNMVPYIKNFYFSLKDRYHSSIDMTIFDDFDPVAKLNQKNVEDKRTQNVLRSFHKEELQTIINKVFEKDSLHKILNETPYYFYAFCFNLFLGMRINEFYRITIDSIKVQEKDTEKIYYIWLNENDPMQSLKNQNAHRNIPIPSLLIELGLLNYINKRKEKNEKWLWKQNKSGYGVITTFFNRKLKKLFPKSVYSIDNRLNSANSLIQMRCLRKNFAERAFEKEKTPYHTTQNNKRLIGHEEGSSTGRYLGRLEPYTGKKILDSNKDYELELITLKEDVKSFYKTIEGEITGLTEKYKEEWKEKSPVRSRTIRQRNSR